jgi:Zn-dependent protease with chaperone function
VMLDAGMVGVAHRLGARPPRTGDLEERQLINIAEEMAVAAGMPPPAVMILDSPCVNVAAFGPSSSDATILVTRGLLDRCDRDETQGAIAHTIAMIGNGDQRLALLLVSVFATLGLVRHILKAPLSKDARRQLRDLLAFAIRSRGAPDRLAEAALLETMLAEDEGSDLDDSTKGGKILLVLLMPFQLAHAFFNLVQFLASFLFLSPTLALLLRRRRYLADATAVQLTRHPEGLQRALHQTNLAPTLAIPGAGQTALMFLVEPNDAHRSSAAPFGLMFSVHPTVGRRYERLGYLGARLASAATSRADTLSGLPLTKRIMIGVLAALLVPLFGLVIYLMLFLIVGGTMISLMVGMLWTMILVLPLDMLLR